MEPARCIYVYMSVCNYVIITKEQVMNLRGSRGTRELGGEKGMWWNDTNILFVYEIIKNLNLKHIKNKTLSR